MGARRRAAGEGWAALEPVRALPASGQRVAPGAKAHAEETDTATTSTSTNSPAAGGAWRPRLEPAMLLTHAPGPV